MTKYFKEFQFNRDLILLLISTERNNVFLDKFILTPKTQLKKYFYTKKKTVRDSKVYPGIYTYEEAFYLALNISFHQKNSGFLNSKKLDQFKAYSLSSPNILEKKKIRSLWNYYENIKKFIEIEKQTITKFFNICTLKLDLVKTIKSGIIDDLTITMLGIIEYFEGRYELAIKVYYIALKISTNKRAIFLLLAKAYEKLNQLNIQTFYLDKAFSCCEVIDFRKKEVSVNLNSQVLAA